MVEQSNTSLIIQALNQAAVNAFPGALDKKGQVRTDIPIGKSNDGFHVSFIGRKMIVKYQGEFTLSEVNEKDFEGEVRQKMADILKYIKKEYKSIKGSAVSLKKEGKTDILIQSLSRFRSWVQAKEIFEIGSISKKETQDPVEKLDETYRKFLSEKKNFF